MAAAAAFALAGCSMVSPHKIASVAPTSAPAPAPSNVPYKWTLGNAPQAHKDMVATFGKVGLAPGQYLWASSVPSEGETRIVSDRLTQMA
jgi:hypothetical protein